METIPLPGGAQLSGNVLFYSKPEPLSREMHGSLGVKRSDKPFAFVAGAHVVPLTVTEFMPAALSYPVIFVGDAKMPVAVMGVNQGDNLFVTEDGSFEPDAYLPAYVRRYPFMLARLQPDAQELSLCFDPTSGLVGDFDEGEPLFADGKPSEATNNVLKFCEEFELSAQRTVAFMNELKDGGLLMDGEVSIQPAGAQQPFIYRGFQMINEEKMRGLEGDELKRMNQNGMLPLILAHLFSVSLVREVFARQIQQGKGPQVAPAGNA